MRKIAFWMCLSLSVGVLTVCLGGITAVYGQKAAYCLAIAAVPMFILLLEGTDK